MGRNKRKRTRDRNGEKAGNQKIPYETCPKENKDFEAYYKIQKICPENQWEEFLTAIRSELPAAFRITSSRAESKQLLAIVKGKYFEECLNAKTDVEENIEPLPMPWYPENLAWQVHLTRRDIRRSEAYFKLHNFLISETASGNISRQEVVSMIPPVVLDVKAHHKVLDMCAAPGSKTAQLIEWLHRQEERMPTGFVIANDVDNNRCYMLVHQAKRLNSPNMIVTNHDASVMPNFYVTGQDGGEEVLKFDRILCDVPCSGDGTLRKNPDIWPRWNCSNGATLHGLQYRIMKRGSEMLTVGGRVVYSTCSLNPIENEAVVARLLLEAQGSLQLLDVSSLLPGLKFSPGMTTWTPTSRDLVTYTSVDQVPGKWQTSITATMFPPTEDQLKIINLEKCVRVLPHHQNTGGFFIALLEKVKPLPWEAKSDKEPKGESATPSESNNEPASKIAEPSRKKRRIYGYKEDPFVFFQEDEPIWKELREFYELNEKFPSNCLLTRCKEGKKKNIYLTSPQVRDIVLKNEHRLKIINTGVKTFAKCDNKEMKCGYRLVQEGLWSIYPWIGAARKVEVPRDDLIILLSCEDLTKPPLTTSLSEVVQKQITQTGQGSCLLLYNDEESRLQLELVGWVGAVSTRAYIPQSDCIHYLRLLGGDLSKFEVNKFQKAKEGTKSLDEEAEERPTDDAMDIPEPKPEDS